MLPFDNRNAKDFMDVSAQIQKGIAIIEAKDLEKATIANLAKLSGVHRNTIRNRGWPIEDLKRINEARAIKRSSSQDSTKTKKLEAKRRIDELIKRLDQSRQEAARWHHLYNDSQEVIEELRAHLALLNKKLSEAKNFTGKVTPIRGS